MTRFIAASAAIVVLSTSLLCGCSYYARTAEPDFVALGPEQVLRRAADAAGDVDELQTVGTLLIQTLQGSFMTRVSALFAAPDSIRLDVSVTLGGLALQAVMFGPQFTIYLPMQSAVIDGVFLGSRIMEIQGIRLDESVVRELVLGPALAWDPAELAARVDQYDVGPEQINLGIEREDGTRLLLCLERDFSYCRTVRLAPDGSILMEARFDGYRRIGSARLPQQVTLHYPDDGLDLILEIVRRDPDPDRHPDDFELRIPPRVQRIPPRGAPSCHAYPTWPGSSDR